MTRFEPFVVIALLFGMFFIGAYAGDRFAKKGFVKIRDLDRQICTQQTQVAVDAAMKHQRDICKRGLR